MSSSQPLSHDDEFAVIDGEFLRDLPHRQELFAATTSFYNTLLTEKGVVSAARELYRWLGTKPVKLSAAFTDGDAAIYHDHHLEIPQALRSEPYQIGSQLALMILGEVMSKKLDVMITESLIETTSIEVGFGALVLNGVSHTPSTLEHWHLGFIGTGTHHQSLSAYSAEGYAIRFGRFSHQAKLTDRAILSHLTAAAQDTMPGYYKDRGIKPLKPPTVTRKQKNAASLTLFKTLGVGLLLSAVLVTSLFVYSQRTYKPSPEVTSQYEKIQKLAKSHDDCVAAVKQKQNAYKQDDIFSEQRINADLVTCQSLENQYNYEVSTYNSMLEKH